MLTTNTSWITYSTAMLTMRRGDIVLSTGSAFLYNRNNKLHIVTAWHNLAGRHTETLAPLSSKGAFPDNILVDMPSYYVSEEYSGYIRMPVAISLVNGDKASFLAHKQKWPRVDVAVLPIDPDADHNHEVFTGDGLTRRFSKPLRYRQPDGSSVLLPFLDRGGEDKYTADTNMEIEHTIGDDLFLLGYPAGITDYLGNPIWKRASFATDPSQNWGREKMFLVDSASRKGMSGCLALYYDKTGKIPVAPGSYLSVGHPVKILLGVYAGRIGDSEFEAQVGRIWKMDVVDEIIESGEAEELPDFLPCAVSEVTEAIVAGWPAGENAEEDLIEGKPRLAYFKFYVMEKIQGRCGADYVERKIVEIAKQRLAKRL